MRKVLKRNKMIITFMTFVFVLSIGLNVFAADVIRNRYYSTYNSSIYNTGTVSPGMVAYGMQYRLNCYGYALQTFLSYQWSVVVDSSGGYKQQPGSFASSSQRSKVKPFVRNNPSQLMSNMVYNMQLDSYRIGYTITEYTPTSSTIPQAPSGKRLIALVTGNTDYHYYMQLSDGTWSHKPGSDFVTNRTINNSSVVITNSNIRTVANQGAYSPGLLKFFYITKDAVTDYPHSPFDESTNQIEFLLKDWAGDDIKSAIRIYTGTTNAASDFEKDVDYYWFRPSSSRTYTFKTICTGNDYDAILYNSQGNVIATDFSTSQVNIAHSLTANSDYYLKVYNCHNRVFNYSLSIQ